MGKKYYVFIILCILILLTGASLKSQIQEQAVQKKYEWKILSVYAFNNSIYQNGMEKFARDVKVISNGQIDIKVYPANEYKNPANEYKIIGPKEVFDAVSSGTVEMGFGDAIYWQPIDDKKKIHGSEFMYAVPFGLNAKDMYAWLNIGEGLKLWKEMYEPFNVVPFPVGNIGGAMGGWFKNEIPETNFKDYFKGLKIRSFALDAKVYEKLGATTDWEIATESLDAYNKGKFNAIICLGPYTDQSYNFYDGPKYYYYPGWQEPGGVLSIIIKKETWDHLPENLQRAIEIVCSSTYQFMSTQFDSMNSRALKELQQKEGVKIREFPPKVLDEFWRLSKQVLDEESKNTEFKKIYDAFKKFKEEYVDSGWSKMLDEAVYSDTSALKLIKRLANSKFAKVTPKGNNSVVITFSGVSAFGSWSSTLNPVLAYEVAGIAKIINNDGQPIPIKWINVEGHAATDGDEYPNWQVSKARANAVEKILKDNGVNASLIRTVAYGEDYPIITPDDTEEKRSINRRVEIVIEF